jgi:hypothetical protein
MSEYRFDKEGLFLAFISHSFHLDGKIIFDEVIKKFFKEHRNRIYDYKQSYDRSIDVMYKPVGYRMFGSQGLLVISLLDDYSFCSRHFNKNHIRSLLEDDSNYKTISDYLKYKSVVVTGVHECRVDEQETKSLEYKARATFLRENEQFPFVGVIRLKIDHQLLQGRGIDAIRVIKNKIEKEKTQIDCNLDYISVDCFDNDEMTVVAFSDCISSLASFLGSIRDLKNDGEDILKFKQGGRLKVKHLFSSTYISLGYNVNFSICDSKQNASFIPINDPKIEKIKINCMIETRPGHRDTYENHLKSLKFLEVSDKNASGGSAIKIELPLNKIHELNILFGDSITERDVRKVRMSVQYKGNNLRSDDLSNHANNFVARVISEDIKKEIKSKLKSIGVSKIVRDRLFALFELFDSSRRDMIQTLYFEELSEMGEIFKNMVFDLSSNNVDIRKIEEILDDEITNFENACYDRVHNRKYAENLLEYSGGVQQHLISFGYAYSVISSILSGRTIGKSIYTIITGADRVSSEITHLNLNINHILFPELFVTTAWKEASNKNIKILSRHDLFDLFALIQSNKDINNKDAKYVREYTELLNTWNDFVRNKASIAYLKDVILQNLGLLLEQDEVLIDFKNIMSQDLLQYFIKDYVVFHFAFLRDFEIMWHFCFKVLLQTSNCYYKLGKIKRVHLIYNLLRLFMVGIRADMANGNHKSEQFILKQKYNPFDLVLQEYWMDCFDKTWTIAKEMSDLLKDYGLLEISEFQITMSEWNLSKILPKVHLENKKDPSSKTKLCGLENSIYINKSRTKDRINIVKTLRDSWSKGAIIDCEGLNSADYIICLLNSFVSEIYKIDIKDSKANFPIKSLQRGDDGEVLQIFHDKNSNNEPLCEKMISILCDTTGGFFLPSVKTREDYFVLRTVLYRSMWNYRMKMSESDQ